MDMNCWCIVCGRWCQTSAEMREHKGLTNHLGFLRAQPTDQYTCRTCDLLLPRVAAVLDHLAIAGHAHVRKLSAAQVEALSSVVPLAGSDSYVVVTEENTPSTAEMKADTEEEENETARYDCCTCGERFLLFDLVNAHTAATGHERFLKTTDLPAAVPQDNDQPAAQPLHPQSSQPQQQPLPSPQQSQQHHEQQQLQQQPQHPHEDGSVASSPLYRLLPSQSSHLPSSSPYPERSTQLSICTQCGKWFATDAVRVDHRNLTGHQLFLPVKEKGARTAYKCLDCSQLLRSASQVAQHQWEYGHDQFATLCESRPLQPEVPGSVMEGDGSDGVAMGGGHSGGAGGMVVGGGGGSRKEVGYFECTECGVRLARSSDLPAHFAKSGHQKFTRLQPCSTGIALETWNHSGRMVRGQVISSLSEAPRGPGLPSSLNNPTPASDSLCPSSSASPAGLGGAVVSGPSLANRRLALPLLPVCVCLCEPHTFRTAVLLVSRHDAAEVDELVDRLRTVVTAGYNLEVSVYHCTLCTKRCHNYNVMLDHGKHYHQVPEDLLEKGVLYMTIEVRANAMQIFQTLIIIHLC